MTGELEKAIWQNDALAVAKVLHRGADVNEMEPKWGRDMLMLATDRGYTEIVRLLLKAGADPNKGWTAVRHSVNENKIAVLGLLIEKGADVTIADREGITPQRIAEIHNNAQVAQMLKEAPIRQQHDLAVKKQQGLKGRLPKPKIIRGPQP